MATGNADEIASLIGLGGLKSLIAARGGTFLRVPSTIAGAAALVQFVGEDAAARLVEAYGGENIYIPNGLAIPSVRARVLELKRAAPTLTTTSIALAIGCSEKTVLKHLKAERAKPGLDCPRSANG